MHYCNSFDGGFSKYFHYIVAIDISLILYIDNEFRDSNNKIISNKIQNIST